MFFRETNHLSFSFCRMCQMVDSLALLSTFLEKNNYYQLQSTNHSNGLWQQNLNVHLPHNRYNTQDLFCTSYNYAQQNNLYSKAKDYLHSQKLKKKATKKFSWFCFFHLTLVWSCFIPKKTSDFDFFQNKGNLEFPFFLFSVWQSFFAAFVLCSQKVFSFPKEG